MTVIIPQLKIAYFAVPKVACTAIKTAFFQIENNTDLDGITINGRKLPIHELYPTRKFSEIPKDRVLSLRRMALVRDPIGRFLSAYRNRVLEKDEIKNSAKSHKLTEMGLPLRPSLSTFISNLDHYRMVRGIDHHVSTMTTFLGRDPNYFEFIFDISESEKMIDIINSITGRHISFARYNTSGHHDRDKLSPTDRDFLKNLYQEDYEMFGRYFR